MFFARTHSPVATRELAHGLAAVVQAGDIIVLSGDLGAGKTAFVQGLGMGLGVTVPITSPTFTLAQRYEGRLPLDHLDVYRLESQGDVIDLDLPELYDGGGVIVIEWGEMLAQVLPQDYLQVTFRFADPELGPDVRDLAVHVVGRSWTDRNPALRSVLGPYTEGH